MGDVFRSEIGTRGMIPFWVMRHISKGLAERRQARAVWVYCAVEAMCRDENQEIDRNTLVQQSGICKNTLDRGIADLVEIGLLQVKPRYRNNMRISNAFNIAVARSGLFVSPSPGKRSVIPSSFPLHPGTDEGEMKESGSFTVPPSSKKYTMESEPPTPPTSQTPAVLDQPLSRTPPPHVELNSDSPLPAPLDQALEGSPTDIVERNSKTVTPDPKPGRAETEAQRRRRLRRSGWTPKQITLMLQGKLDEQGHRTDLWLDEPAPPPRRSNKRTPEEILAEANAYHKAQQQKGA